MIVDCAVYERGVRRPGQLALDNAFEACREIDAFVWIGLFEPNEEEFDAVRREFELHDLAVEDAIKAHQRPKLEVYGDSLFVVLKTARWLAEHESIVFGEILLFLGDGFIISVRHGETELHGVRLRTEQQPELMRLGPSGAAYAIVDKVVDDYEPVIHGLDNSIRAVEGEVFSPSRANPAERIFALKRCVLELYGATVPLLDPLGRLAREDHPLVADGIGEYFRDVQDHLIRVVQQVSDFRDLLTGILTANLTQASVRQNEDVRRISAWAAIIAVPTAIAGLYGMNFEHMPELGWTFAYPLVIAIIVAMCVALYTYFRKVGWL
jgi:magnesium transporter